MAANHEKMQNAYVGKPLAVALKGLGYPEKELKLGNRQVLSWHKASAIAECDLRLEVDEAGVVVGESLHGTADACSWF